MLIARLILIIALIVGPPMQRVSAADTAIDLLNNIRTDMRAARASGDWHAYLTAAKRQAELLNVSPMSQLEIARAQAHLQDARSAFDALSDFVEMGQSHDLLESLPDFALLREKPEFVRIRARAAENRKPIARSVAAIRIKELGLLPEDIDYDSRSRRFFVSSVLQSKIVTITMQGDSQDFALSPDGWPVFALKIDHAKQLLWATEVAMQGFVGVDEHVQGRSAILCYELRSGKLLKRIEGPRPSALGDITLAQDGAVIVSDGEQGGIYRAHYADDHIERIDAGDFISPQATVLAADSGYLIVPDYLRGLGLLETKTKRVNWFSSDGRYAFNGIDGLYLAGRKLIAVQNGTMPARIVVFSLNTNGTKIVEEKVIERSTKTLGDPTHGVIVGNNFYYIANSGWDVVDDNGRIKSGMNLPEAVIMRMDLRKL